MTFKAPPPHRRHGRPARHQPDRRQPQRHHPADPARGRRAGARGQGRPTAAQARDARGRPRLRPRRLPAPAAPAWHPPPDRPSAHRPRLGAGSPALAGRAQPLLAAPVPPPAGALRAPGRHPRGVPHARLLPDLPQEAPGIILKSALSGDRRSGGRRHRAGDTCAGVDEPRAARGRPREAGERRPPPPGSPLSRCLWCRRAFDPAASSRPRLRRSDCWDVCRLAARAGSPPRPRRDL
jgi:hypothetical protein